MCHLQMSWLFWVFFFPPQMNNEMRLDSRLQSTLKVLEQFFLLYTEDI